MSENLSTSGDLIVGGTIAAADFVIGGSNSFTVKPYSLEVKRLEPDAILPTKAHDGDLGFDLYALEDVTLNPGEVTKVRTGIACNFPKGFGALIRDRSSVATKKQVFTVAGVIDQGYRGEIIVAFYNPGRLEVHERNSLINRSISEWYYWGGPVQFQKGDKIAQMILTPVVTFPVEEVDDLTSTTRGSGGFGSTGR